MLRYPATLTGKLCATFFVAFSLSMLAAGHAFSQDDRKLAVSTIRNTVVQPLLQEFPHPYGLRVHLYEEMLVPGTLVMPVATREDEVESLACTSRCLLFFIDRNPRAHFAHPVVIALWDLDLDTDDPEERLDWIDAEWWPVVGWPDWRGFPPAGEQVFNTVASRAHPDERVNMIGVTTRDEKGIIVLDIPPQFELLGPSRFGGIADSLPSPTPGTPPPSTLRTPVPTPTPTPTPVPVSTCPVWAVIVNGDPDLNDTFDEDARGMYTVLRGLDVPAEQVYYLSPHHAGDPAVLGTIDEYRQRTTYANLVNVLNHHIPDRIAQSGSTCEEFLFFISTHGFFERLSCVAFEGPHGDYLWASTLDGLLQNIDCNKVTVVIEACQSGSFIDPLIPGSPNPQTSRRIFTSTDVYGASQPDVDTGNDPNLGDAGSETIWGYIEAFGSSAADKVLPIGRISFEEAVRYAIDNDVTWIEGTNNPQVCPLIQGIPPPPQICSTTSPPSALLMQPSAHSCYVASASVDLDVVDRLTSGSGSLPTNLSLLLPRVGRPASVTVRNTGQAPLSVATVKLFWPSREAWDSVLGTIHTAAGGFPPDTWLDAGGLLWPDEFTQYGETTLIAGLPSGASREFEVNWPRRLTIRSAVRVPLLAILDSPQDPVMSGPVTVEVLLKVDNNAGVTTTSN